MAVALQYLGCSKQRYYSKFSSIHFLQNNGGSFAWTVCGIAFAVGGNGIAGLLMTGAGIFGAGLAIFFFFGCKAATRGVVWLTKKIVLGLKKSLLKKEEA